MTSFFEKVYSVPERYDNFILCRVASAGGRQQMTSIDVRTKSLKIDSLPPCLPNVGAALSVWTNHNFQKS